MEKDETKNTELESNKPLNEFSNYLKKVNEENFEKIRQYIDFSSYDENNIKYLIGEFIKALKNYASYINFDNAKFYNFSFSMRQIKEMVQYVFELNSIAKEIEEISNSCFGNDLIEVIKLDAEKSLKDNKLCFLHTLSYIETMKMFSGTTKESILNANAKDKEYTRQLLGIY